MSLPNPYFYGVKIRVADVERAKDFYVNVMGMQNFEYDEFPEFKEHCLSSANGQPPILIVEERVPGEPVEMGNVILGICFLTDDIHALFDRIVAAGGKVVQEPRRIRAPEPGPYTREEYFGYVQSPEGHTLEAVQIISTEVPQEQIAN